MPREASPRSRGRAAARAARASCGSAQRPRRHRPPARSRSARRSRRRGGRSPRRSRRSSARPRTSRRGSPRAAPSLVVRSDSASTFASFHFLAPRAVSASPQRAARTPGTLFAAIDAPVPVQQQTTPWSARPSATSRAAASLAHAQSSRSSSLSAPCTIGSWPRRRSSSTTDSATPVRSSAAMEILTALSLVLKRARVARGRDHRAPPDGGAGRRARGVRAGARARGAEDVRPAARSAGRARARRRAADREDARRRGGRPHAADPPDVGRATPAVRRARIAPRPRLARAGAARGRP